MADSAAAPRPDVTDMYAVHGVFRDTLGAAPVLVGGVAADDAARAALVANYYENVLSFLEAHHDGEEKLVFPLLRDRCDGAGALIDELDEQHQEALSLLGSARDSLAAWPRGGASGQQATQESLVALGAASGAPPHERGDQCAPAGRGIPLARGVGGAARARHGRVRRGQDLADPRSDPGADER